MKKKVIIVGLVLLTVSVFLLLRNRFQQKPFISKPPLAEEKHISCAKGDTACIAKNAKKLTRQLSGITIEFAKHQCDGPRICPTPKVEDIEAATTAIREYTRDSNLQVIPINGTTPVGIIYYCAKDNQCWSIDAKTNKIISTIKNLPSPTSSKGEPYSSHP